MGFDFHWVDLPAETTGITDAMQRLDAEYEAGAWLSWPYGGFARIQRQMEAFGMLSDVEPPAIPDGRHFQTVPGQGYVACPHGADQAHEQTDYPSMLHPDDWPEMPAECRAYELAVYRWRTFRAECPGIPRYKFGSSDGFLVWPDEIASAIQKRVEAAEAGVELEHCEPEYWLRWIGYLAEASKHGGFVVR